MLDDDLLKLSEKGELNFQNYNPGSLFRKSIFIQLYSPPQTKKLNNCKSNVQIIYFSLPKIIKYFLLFFPVALRLVASRIYKKILKDTSLSDVRLIRVFGHGLSLQLGVALKRKIHKPILASLHGNPDVDYLRGRRSGKNPFLWLLGKILQISETNAWRYVNYVFGVYEPIRPYLEKYAKNKYSIIPNIVSSKILYKKSYLLGKQTRIVNVGRQEIVQKDPRKIIKAVANLPSTSLTCYGTGGLNQKVCSLVKNLSLQNRVKIIPRKPNSQIVKKLKAFDLFAYQSDNYEISKGCIEAALAGLPIIVNRRNGEMAKEIHRLKIYLVENSTMGFTQGIAKFAKSKELRAKWGTRSRQLAMRLFDPKKVESRHVKLIRRVLAQNV